MRQNFKQSLKVFSFLSLFILGSVFLRQAIAQAPDNKGKDFWLMFPGNLSGGTLTLFITGDVSTSGTVAVPGLAFSTPFSVIAGSITSVIIPTATEVLNSNLVESKGIHVTSLDEVTVYGLNRRQATTDAFLGLPTDILGTAYLNLGYKNSNVVNGTQFGIVASQDITTITITPTVTTDGHAAGVAYNIMLNQGQTYLLKNTGLAPNDLSGTSITSDKPIAVFGGHQCANIPPGVTFCDYIVEQLTPTNTWGKNFVTVPLKTRLNGDTFRFIASEDNTDVSVNGVVVATLSAGQLHEMILTGSSQINSTKPIMVAQYSNGTSFDGVTSDPFMMLIPPYEQFLDGYTITTPASGFALNFVNVAVPNAAVGSILLDGVAIPAGSFSPIGVSGFSGAQVDIALGAHNFTGNLPFGVFVYGFANADSYGYPGGMSLAPIATVTTVELTPENGTAQINTEQCWDALVKDQNDNPVEGVRVDFTITGANPGSTGFAFTDANGIAHFCYTGTNGGDDNITACVGTVCDVASTFTWTACNIVLSETNTDVLCHGASTGAIDLTIQNATEPLTIVWSNGANTEDISGLPAGTYSVMVTDANGCEKTLENIEITEPATAVSCDGIAVSPSPTVAGHAANTIYLGYGPQTVTLTGSGSGGTGSLTYDWAHVAGTDDGAAVSVSPTVTTTYTLTVRDENGCESVCEVTINVVDVRCGSKLDKVLVCHKQTTASAETICIANAAVATHLAHGDYLGNCTTVTTVAQRSGATATARISPEGNSTATVIANPGKNGFLISLKNYRDNQKINISVTDVLGRLIDKKDISGSTTQLRLGANYNKGLYFITIVQGKERKTLKVLRE